MVTDPRFFPKDGRAGDAAASFSADERDRRWNAVRAAMDERGLDCLIVIGPRQRVAGRFARDSRVNMPLGSTSKGPPQHPHRQRGRFAGYGVLPAKLHTLC